MAELIPPLASCVRRMQAGEKRFAQRLVSHCEDDYLCWYESRVGLRPRYTDFVILHPLRGLLLLEVKDWRLDTLRLATPDSVELLTDRGLKTVPNPLQQARQCLYQLVRQLERDPQLVHPAGPHRGKLIMPWGFGVVFTSITRAQFDRAGLAGAIPAHQVICKDEMVEAVDPEDFQKRLWDMFNYCFHQPLTQPQIDRIRWHLFPEIRLDARPQLGFPGVAEVAGQAGAAPARAAGTGAAPASARAPSAASAPAKLTAGNAAANTNGNTDGNTDAAVDAAVDAAPSEKENLSANWDANGDANASRATSDGTFNIPDVIRVMDLRQESLARGLGAGHRVIHGVAGSGKTMILGYRCLHLARVLRKPILVLCFNAALAARLGALIEEKGVSGQVNVYNIHRWASTMLKTYNFPVPALRDGAWDAAIEMLMTQVARGHIPRGQYGAVLIDEGHDFKKEWLKLVVDMVDPDTNSLLLLYDDTQSIYQHSRRLGFSLKDVGIEAQGRTTILRLNYRNTQEILKFAYDFVTGYLGERDGAGEGVPIVAPESAGRHGPRPVVKRFASFEEEAAWVARVFRKLHAQRGRAWSDMCVLYGHHWMGEALAAAMAATQIPVTWLRDAPSKHGFDAAEASVKLLTMHSSKGLEFPVVAVCGVGFLGRREERLEDDARLLYVAMTRATENLMVTSCRASAVVERLEGLAEQLAEAPAGAAGAEEVAPGAPAGA